MTPAEVKPKRTCRDCQQTRDADVFVRRPFANGRGSFEVCRYCAARRKKPQPLKAA